jgi:hypothetical protein
MNTVSRYILILSNIPLFISVIYAAAIYKKLGSELKLFSLFLFFSGGIELISGILWFNSMNNLPLLHLYVAGGFVFLSLFYKKVLEGFIDPRIINGIMAAFLTFTLVNSVFIQPIFTFNSNALTVESILIMILSLSTFILMMNDLVKRKRLGLASSLNWINSALFVYYSSNLIIFYFGNLITHSLSKEFSLQTWMLHAFFSTVMYVCFSLGLWYRPKV